MPLKQEAIAARCRETWQAQIDLRFPEASARPNAPRLRGRTVAAAGSSPPMCRAKKFRNLPLNNLKLRLEQDELQKPALHSGTKQQPFSLRRIKKMRNLFAELTLSSSLFSHLEP